mgnify:CR=1 FL=1
MKNRIIINIVSEILLMTPLPAALSAHAFMSVPAHNAAPVAMHDSAATAPMRADSLSVERDGSRVRVSMNLELSDLNLKSSRAVLFTPCLAGDADTLALPSVGVYGRQRWFYYRRMGDGMISGHDEKSLRAGRGLSGSLPYIAWVRYEPWMDSCSLMLRTREYACCGETVSERIDSLAGPLLDAQSLHDVRQPLLDAQQPEQVPATDTPEPKSQPLAQPQDTLLTVPEETEAMRTYAISGRADIDFRLNRTEVDLTYGNNFREMQKIHSTIDSLRAGEGITVTKIRITGYASPEGGYRRNADLAERRTATVCDYVRTLYDFAPGVVVSSSVPEDWDGFVAWLENCDLPHAAEILAVARDANMAPDAKEKLIRRNWPEDARFIIAKVFPELRRSEYRIEYVVERVEKVSTVESGIEQNKHKQL